MTDHHQHHSMPSLATNATTTVPPSTVIQAVLTTMMTMHHNSSSMEASSQHPSHHIHDHLANSADRSSYVGDHASADHNMLMYFHSGVDAIILFKEWNVSSTQGMIGSVIGIFLMAMLYEGIKFFREYMFKRYFTSLEYSSVSVLGDDGRTVTEVHKVARNRMFSWPHFIQTALHVVQMILSYFLMLIFMTYNIWLCLGVVIGAGTGYFLFGWKKATVVDITEHCH